MQITLSNNCDNSLEVARIGLRFLAVIQMKTMALTVSKNKFLFFLSLVIFRALLDCSYYFVVADIFVYDGFAARVEFEQYASSWLYYIVGFGFASDRVLKVSHYFFSMAVLSVVAPLTSLYGLDSERSIIPVIVTLAALYLIYYVSRLRLIDLRRLPLVSGGTNISIAISLIFVVFLVVWFFISGAKPNLDFTKVYQYRETNSELAGKGVFAYTNNWTYQVFSIYLISFALYYKRYFYVIALLVVQFYFFAIASHKAILFLPLLVFGAWFYFRLSNSLLALPVIFNVIIGVSILSYFALDDVWMTSLLSRRVFFVPAQLCFVYFDFFSNNPHVYWSNSVLSAFSKYPYGDLAVPYVIGEYLERPGMGANNGFVSSGFAHAGLFGVFFYALIIGVILKLINSMTSENMPVWVAVALSVVPLRSLLTTSDLFTVMLTHGFGVAIVLIYLSRSTRTNRSTIKNKQLSSNNVMGNK